MDFHPVTSGEMVVGGSTSNTGITSSTVAAEGPLPLAVYIREGGAYLWRKYFYTGLTGIGHDQISAIKFLNNNGAKIIAGFSSSVTNTKNSNLLFATLNPSNGEIIKTYSYAPTPPAYSKPSIKPGGLLYEATSEDVYVAGQFESKWTFIKFSSSSTNPVSPNFYYTLGASVYSRAHAVEIDRANSRLFVSGQYDAASNQYSLLSAFHSSGIQLWGKQANPTATFVAHYLSYFDSGVETDHKLYGCGDNNVEMHILRANLPSPFTTLSPTFPINAPLSSNFDLYQYGPTLQFKCRGLQAIDQTKMYALGDRHLGLDTYLIHMIKVDFSPGNVQASYHSLVEISSREENSVLFARFKDSQLYAMGCLRRVEPLGDNPRLYDEEGTGYLLKYSATGGTASLSDSCFRQKTISYLSSGFNPITHTWVDPGVNTVNEELSTTTSRSFFEATTGLNSADIKQTEVLVEKIEDEFSQCVGVASFSGSLRLNTPAIGKLTYFMNNLPEDPTFVNCPAFQLTSTGIGCTDPLISYVLTDSNQLPLPTEFVFTEVPDRRLDWSLAKNTARQIQIIVKGVLPDGSIAGTYSFQVNIVDCVTATVTSSASVVINPYQVNSPQALQSYGTFTKSQPLCQLEYFLEAQSDYSYPSGLFSVIQLSSDFSQIQIYAANNDYIGKFYLQVRAKVKNGGSHEAIIDVTADILPQCSLSRITKKAVSSKIYILPGNYDLVVADLDWVQSPAPDTPAGNGCEKMIYELIDVNTNVAISPNPFILDAQSQSQYLFTTNDYLLAGTTYNLMLSAYIQDPSGVVLVRSNSSPFTLQILTDSPQNEVTPLSQNVLTPLRQVNYQDYTVGDPAIVFYVTWAESVGESVEIAYSISMEDGTNLPVDSIKFDEDDGKFTVSTNERKKAGVYSIKVTGLLQNMMNVTASQVFKVHIKDFCEDPSIIIPSLMTPLQHVLGSEKQIISFTPWSDSHKGLCGPFTFSINYRSYPALEKVVALSQDQKSLIIKSTSDPALSGQTFSVTLKGSLQSRASKEIDIKISFQSAIQNETIKVPDSPQQKKRSLTNRQPLLGRILSVDTEGRVKLRFNMSVKADFELLEAMKESIKVTIRGDNSSDGEPTLASIKSWAFEKTRVHEQEITIRVEFAESSFVSIRSEGYDVIEVEFQDDGVIRSMQGKNEIKSGYKISSLVPPQGVPIGGVFALAKSVGQAAQTVITSSISANFLLCILFGISMSRILQLINVLQIITIMPLLNLKFPPEFLNLCQTLIKNAQLDLIPPKYSASKLVEDFLQAQFGNPNFEFEIPIAEGDKIKIENPNFALLGYETESLIANLKQLINMMIVILVCSVCIVILKQLGKRWPILLKVHDHLSEQHYFSSFIQTMIQVFFGMSISIFLASSKYHQSLLFEQIIMCLMSVINLAFFIAASFFLLRYFKRLSEDSIQKRFGSLYDQIREQQRSSTLYIPLYMIRRLILGATIVFLYPYPALQVIIYIISTLLMMQYMIAKCHFQSKMMWIQEIINETAVAVLALNMIPMCEGLIEAEMRIKQGSQMVYVVLGCIGTNFISFAVTFLHDIYQAAKKVFKQLRARFGNQDRVVKIKGVNEFKGNNSIKAVGFRRANYPFNSSLQRDLSMLQQLQGEEQDVSKIGLNDQSFISRNIDSMQNNAVASRFDKVVDVSNRRNESIKIDNNNMAGGGGNQKHFTYDTKNFFDLKPPQQQQDDNIKVSKPRVLPMSFKFQQAL